MSSGTPVDESAAAAASADHVELPAPGLGLAPRPGRSTPRGVRWRLVAVGLVLLGAAGFLVVEGLGGSLDYFETVDQAVSQRATLADKTFRLEGVVAPGSRQAVPGGVRFVAQGAHHEIVVVNHGDPPQLFQDGIPVVVVGHFSGDLFVSSQLIVDHSNQYIEQHPARVRAPDGSVR